MALSTKAEILDICPSPYGYAVFVQAAKKIFVIYVDRARGMAMQSAMPQCKSARPLTYEFIAQMLDGLECRVKGVLIYHVCEGTFYTRMTIEMKNELGSKIVDVDGRPSDTIAIAMRTGAPIYVSEDVLSKVSDMSEAFNKIKGAR